MLLETKDAKRMVLFAKAEKLSLEKSLGELAYQIDGLKYSHAPDEEIMYLIDIYADVECKYHIICNLIEGYESNRGKKYGS